MIIKNLAIIFFILFLSKSSYAQLYFPDNDLDSLFHKVQIASIFSDSKTFADASPKKSVSEIIEEFHQRKNQIGFDIKDFVLSNFNIPSSTEITNVNLNKTLSVHLDSLWGTLRRGPDSTGEISSLIPLPFQYIVPGGRFREIYYWDSYFTMLGLQASGNTKDIENMLDNFAYLINTFGFIPNGNRTYYLSRSQPPFFGSMVEFYASITSPEKALKYLPYLEKEYNFWMTGDHVVELGKGTKLNRYWDKENKPRAESYREDFNLKIANPGDTNFYRNIRAACESGWDFSSRWLANGKDLSTIETTNIIPADLNSLLYQYEILLARLYDFKLETITSKKFREAAKTRKINMNKVLWDKKSRIFQDYNFAKKKFTDRYSLASAYPLFFKIASKSQAKKSIRFIKSRFSGFGGYTSTLVATGQQWDSPNGWPPLQWITYRAFLNYGYQKEAEELKTNWLDLVTKTFLETGRMLEKYDVLNPGKISGGGEYPTQDGFGWTNGVTRAFMEGSNIKK